MKCLALMLTAVLGVLLLAACGSGTTPTATPNPRLLDVTLNEYGLVLSKAIVPAGSVTINAKNAGVLAHEVVVIRTDLDPESLVVEGSLVAEEATGTSIGRIESEELQSDQSASGVFDLSPGKYVLIYNIATHYQLGMTTGLTVQ